MQMLVLAFDRTRFEGEIMPELERLKDQGIIRLVDLMFVMKREDGEVEVIQTSDLDKDEATELGALIGVLVGLGTGDEEVATRAAVLGAAEGEAAHLLDEQDVWYLADAIPKGTSAAIALIEHRWAIPLRDKIVDAGGVALADEWIHPADLMTIGAAVSMQEAATTTR